MPINLIKQYPELLELVGSLYDMRASLRRIYVRDVEDNPDFKFRGIPIHPIKAEEGQLEMVMTFAHLTTREYEQSDENGSPLPPKREFDIKRSRRLHWINHHVHERTPENIQVFTVIEWDKKKHQDVTHTYIYDMVGKYVIVFDRRQQKDFRLLTAYYLDEPYAEKMMKKKMKKKLTDVL